MYKSNLSIACLAWEQIPLPPLPPPYLPTPIPVRPSNSLAETVSQLRS